MTYYERLRVAPTATHDQIREAYRRAAREAHPDRSARQDAEARMAAINEAYRVLGNPTRRRRYDEEIGAPVAPPYSERQWATADHDRDVASVFPDVTPARFPWKFMAVLASLGIGVIVLGLIFSKPTLPAAPDNILRSADCVELSPQLDAAEVSCSGEHDAVVRVLVPFGDTCPGGSEPYRDRQGMGTACVVRVSP